MAVHQREELFLDNQKLIRYIIWCNAPLVRQLRMDEDDMFQELAICLLQALDSYDPSRGKKIKNYCLDKLQYGILDIARKQRCMCRVANLTAQSLAYVNDDGEETEIEIPYYEEYDIKLTVSIFLESLSKRERDVLQGKQDGVALTDKRQKAYLELIRRKAKRYFQGGL